MGNNAYRVWRLHDNYLFAAQPDEPAFCVNADSHEEAASEIAMELGVGGRYRVHATDLAGDAKLIRVVKVTTFEAVHSFKLQGASQ